MEAESKSESQKGNDLVEINRTEAEVESEEKGNLLTLPIQIATPGFYFY